MNTKELNERAFKYVTLSKELCDIIDRAWKLKEFHPVLEALGYELDLDQDGEPVILKRSMERKTPQQQTKQPDWLKSEVLKRMGENNIFEVHSFREAKNKQMSDYLVDLTDSTGVTWTFSLREGSNRLNSLIKTLGEDTDQWDKQHIKLIFEENDFGNPGIIAIAAEPAPSPSKKPASGLPGRK